MPVVIVLVAIVIVLLVLLVRLIVHMLVTVVSAAASGIGHAAVAVAHFVAVVAPWAGAALAIAILAWLAGWLAAESWYAFRDRRQHQAWLGLVGLQLAGAAAPGELFTGAGLPPPPRPPAFGRGADHPWTPPIPGFLQELVLARARAAGRCPPEDREEDSVIPRAAAPVRPWMPPATKQKPPPSGPAPGRGVRRGLAPLSQLAEMRELVMASAPVARSDLAIGGSGSGLASGRRAEARHVSRCQTSAWVPPQRIRQDQHRLRVATENPYDRVAHARGRVIVARSRGVQVGMGNRQYNLYTYRVDVPRIDDLAKRLERTDVAAAVRRLAAEPGNAAARRDLVRRLSRGDGLFLGGPATRLRIVALQDRSGRDGSWLGGTVIFRHVTGGQVGDHSVQRNEFCYTVAPTGSARELLASNPRLARALVDYAFPQRGRRDAAGLQGALRGALEGTRVTPADGRIRDRHYEFPQAGRTLRIRAHDGMSVGESRVRTTYRTLAEVPRSYGREADPAARLNRLRQAEARRSADDLAERTRNLPWLSGPGRDGPGLSR